MPPSLLLLLAAVQGTASNISTSSAHGVCGGLRHLSHLASRWPNQTRWRQTSVFPRETITGAARQAAALLTEANYLTSGLLRAVRLTGCALKQRRRFGNMSRLVHMSRRTCAKHAHTAWAVSFLTTLSVEYFCPVFAHHSCPFATQ